MKKYLPVCLLVILLNNTSYAQNLAAGLFGYLPYTNGALGDSAGAGLNTGSCVSCTPTTDECNDPNDAMHFNGSGYQSVSTNGLMDFSTTGNFSFAYLVKTISSAAQDIFTNYSPTKGWMSGFVSANVGRISFCMGGTQPVSISTTNTYHDNTWHEAVVTVDRSAQRVKIYVDGAQQNLIKNSAGGVLVGNNELDISATGSNGTPGVDTTALSVLNRIAKNFLGSIDQLRFYNRVLTQADVNALSALRCGFVGFHDFADASGVEVYPNPANDQLAIHSSYFQTNERITVSILNMLGEMLQSEMHNPQSAISLDVSKLSPGIYFLQLKGESGSLVKRFVKD